MFGEFCPKKQVKHLRQTRLKLLPTNRKWQINQSETDEQTDTQTDGQTDRQAERERDRETARER